MADPIPAVPTRLLEVTVSAKPPRTIGWAVTVARGAPDDPDTDGSNTDDGANETAAAPVAGPGAQALPDGFALRSVCSGKAGEVHLVPVDGVPGWLLGVGSRSAADWRTAGAALTRAVRGRADADHDAGRRVVRSVSLPLAEDIDTESVAALTLGAMLGGYRFAVSNEPRGEQPNRLHLVVAAHRVDELAGAVHRAGVLARATGLAKDLANAPSNVKTPDWLARTATRALRGIARLTVRTRDERWLAAEGFGGTRAVGGGSTNPPRLIEITWPGSRGVRNGPHLVLVGKGITFDTGGISVKPNAGMHLMRTDMAGGGAVIAAMRAIAELELPVRVSALVCAAENHVSGSAYRPGDVVRHFGGQTTEVINTDAEGRLVLADALVYARTRLHADVLVDVATLTGAMKVALGLRTGGVFASTDELAEQVLAAGDSVAEQWWRMPLLAEHAEDVYSETADLRQVPPGPAGITAALYLREFTGALPWAHLDIAGPARAETNHHEVVGPATGFATRTLVALAAALGSGGPG